MNDFTKRSKKKNLSELLGEYRMNYLMEIDLHIDTVFFLFFFLCLCSAQRFFKKNYVKR